jgi:hypothetical protein
MRHRTRAGGGSGETPDHWMWNYPCLDEQQAKRGRQ